MKTIKIRTFEKVMVPVMRNGKPTKKTKAEWRPILVDIEMDCIEYEGPLNILGYSGSTTKGWGGRSVKINW